ncbi:helix-turn-helix domain-containing protein [Gottfriedia acidiceleris]|uniref:helix-turn-helix domain-containing protein n=1 Tax=Gottfriedia acidiceleris TaxID=371036 RepID=UPI00101B948B|nr:helix-turn-helix transcriptional regulator [Gottfriedia acidiceleris]
MPNIGERIKNLREKKNWSQKELATRVKLHTSVLNRIENNTRPIKDEELLSFANIFDTTTDFILGRSLSANLPEKNSLTEIQKLVSANGIENISFFDIEKWKNLSSAEIELVKQHFEMVAKIAAERNEK